ncbi:MAG: PAS domain S-box protein [Negativicutes bacterium]|nr:PAS domain S-box protein [Negativicutes bacterium]
MDLCLPPFFDQKRVRDYSLAFLIVLTATLLRWWADSSLGANWPYITYYAAVAVAAGIFGRGPGLFVTFSGLIIGYVFFLEGRDFVFNAEMIRMMIYLGCGIIISWFAGKLHTQQRLSKLNEHQIKESERHYRTLVENLPIVISRYDKELHYTYMSPQWDDLFHQNSKMKIGKTWAEVGISEEIYRPWRDKFTEALQTGRTVEFESRNLDIGGETWDFLTRVVPETSEEGQVESLLAVSLNITERNEAHEALRQSEDRFKRLFNDSPAMIAILRFSDDRYIEINHKFAENIGYTREEVLGRTPAEMNIRMRKPEVMEPFLAKLLEDGEIANVEYNIRTKAGKILTVIGSFTLFTFNGELCRLISMQDITKEKMMETELLRLDRLNTVGEMAAAIGHEVRNPLTTVRGYLQMFLRKPESTQYHEQFTTMIEELDRANVIISDFLSLAKNKTIELKANNLNDVISTLLPLLQAEALRTGHELTIDRGDIFDISMDEKEIRQLLLNLARNAFEAMEPGGKLTIRTNVENGNVVLSVCDTGTGIPQEVLDKLGTPFLTTKENGTGLGLAVCYRIAERHKAKIFVKPLAQGTAFSIHFKVS